ncbi:glycosyltransferase family 2 protein [Brevundimonas sp. FT23042]|uniref:glycosyltransferase family 2 protein n=1 Tax=Brevundimonas sp. FT23042 TaxID=3393749 RepID=UPI003B586E30
MIAGILIPAGWIALHPSREVLGLIASALGVAFLGVAGWRCLLVIAGLGPPEVAPEPAVWPRYTVLAALYDEAEIIEQLIERLSRLDYPPDRLQGMLVLEARDAATIAAARGAARPDWLTIFVAPPGAPSTKPRALNCALPHATGELLTVYDAEDAPDPAQLKEAAARFVADGGGRLACLQAPLRIRPASWSTSPFIDAQFAAEYASLFETALPGLTRLGFPFPLGGTSNHFRVDVLRAVGGWDAWNVTEDADLGFRLWRLGWRLGVIRRPTWETPPGRITEWLPQRTRWLKGYMQTFGVHSRDPLGLGLRGGISLVLTLGLALVAAGLYGPTLSWVIAGILVSVAAGLPPDASGLALSVLVLGAATAWLSCAVGARRAGIAYGAWDMIRAPAYWCLLSLAFCHAAWRLVAEPFAWNKTRHRREAPATPDHAALDETALPGLSAAHVAAPESLT